MRGPEVGCDFDRTGKTSANWRIYREELLVRRIWLYFAAFSIALAGVVSSIGGSANASGFSGWSSETPAQIASGGGINPLYKGSAGCSGYYTGTSPKEMKCRTSAYTIHGTRVVVRYGYWTGTTGFGWSKAYYYHNLYLQPIVGTISMATPRGYTTDKIYEVYHYQTGVLNQEVIVVADLTATSFKGVNTPDGKSIGVLTGYCKTGNGVTEKTCPTWVDTTPTL